MKNKNLRITVSRIKNYLGSNTFIKRESSCTLSLYYTDNIQQHHMSIGRINCSFNVVVVQKRDGCILDEDVNDADSMQKDISVYVHTRVFLLLGVQEAPGKQGVPKIAIVFKPFQISFPFLFSDKSIVKFIFFSCAFEINY